MIKKLFRQMLLTQVMSAMTVMICMLIDSIMIGRFLGVNSMTAYGLASPVLMVFAALGSMLSAGIQVQCGKTMGVGDREATDSCFSVSVFAAACISVIGLALVLLFTGPIATLLGAGPATADNEVHQLTVNYLRGFIIGAPAFIFAQIMVPYMQMSGNRTRLVVAVGVMTIGDVVFDLLNVFVVKAGMFGMGLASSLSYYIAFFIGVVYFFKKKCMFHFHWRGVQRKTTGKIVTYGMPTIINQVSLVLMVFLFNQILLSVSGNTAVAAYSVISTVGNICYSFCFGIGSVALMLSSIFYTDEDRSSLRVLVKTMSYFSVLLCGIVTIAAVLLASPLVGLFLTDDPSAKEMAVLGLRLFSLSLIPSALNTSFKNYYQGINRTGYTHMISILQSLVFSVAFAFILSRFLAATGVWLAFLCAEVSTLLVIAVLIWSKNKQLTLSSNAFAFLPADFGASEKDCFEMTIKDQNDVVIASQQADDFCKQHGESAKNSMMIALCIEEMVNNIVEHGFEKDNKSHNVDVRLVIKPQRRVIRIRDNCVNFDPVEYMKLHEADDPTSHIGIRMVMKMVTEANYVNSLGLNNLTLVL